jgi:hypothetical protein
MREKNRYRFRKRNEITVAIRDRSIWLLSAIWFGLLVAGIAWWERATMTPGRMGPISAREAEPGDWRVSVYLHPQCPCGRASLEVLNALRDAEPKLAIRIAIVVPTDAPADWHRGPAWDAARAIPGATVVGDSGAEARSHGAETSGHAEVADPTGRIVYRGGLTLEPRPGAARAWFEWMRDYAGERIEAPVYGCPLFSPNP